MVCWLHVRLVWRLLWLFLQPGAVSYGEVVTGGVGEGECSRNGKENLKLRWITGVVPARRERATAERCRNIVELIVVIGIGLGRWRGDV